MLCCKDMEIKLYRKHDPNFIFKKRADGKYICRGKKKHGEKERYEENILNVNSSCLDGGLLMNSFYFISLIFNIFGTF